ncbi:MAG TPA: hypothetical protein H9860_00760 [Candidatus Gemmiger faecavium]|nr:hypothetical protein [Candidatus Gemmiger faecavium]
MKKMFATLLFGSVLAVTALAVPAQGSGEVTLSASSGGAQVSLEMPADTVQDVTTMHMSFVISSDADISANFDFNDALKSSVQESRYENGRLDVFISGSQNIFTDGTLNLGEVLLTTADGTAAQATVSVDGDSIELLNAAYGSPEMPEIAPVEAEVSVSGTNSGSGGDNGNNSGNGGSGNQSGSGNSSNSGNGSNGSQSTTAQSETSGVTGGTSVTTPATQNGGSSSGQSGSSNKGNSATATPDPESTSSPEEETSRPDNAENTKPEGQTEAASTPEQATDEQQQSSGFPLMLIVAVIAVLAIAAGVVIFIRRRS